MIKKINTSRLQKQRHFSVGWVITCEYGTEIKDLIRPEFYCDIANQINKNDTIRAIFDDGSYIVDLLVIDIDKQNLTPLWLKTVITNLIDIEKAKNFSIEEEKKEPKKEVDASIDFNDPFVVIKFRGPAKKWSVLRKGDNAILREGISSKEEVITIAQELSKQLG
jgi:hypothetical protein